MRRTRRHRAEEPVEEVAPSAPDPPAEPRRADSTSEQERHLRTRADFDNYKRRAARDRDAACGLDGMRRRLGSVLDAEGVKIGRGYLWNGEFLRTGRVRAPE